MLGNAPKQMAARIILRGGYRNAVVRTR